MTASLFTRAAVAAALWALAGGLASPARAEVDLSRLTLPPGFSIEVIARVPNARQVALGDDGVLYVGTRREGGVYAVADGETFVIDEGLTMPSGVAFRDGDLYVGAVGTLYVYRDIGAKLSDPPEPEVVTDALPDDAHHGWKFLRFGPDGKLYIPVGANCNVCEADSRLHNRILRLDVSTPGAELETFAEGVRNSVGFDWDPRTGELWFTDNGRDMLGDETPGDELNHAPSEGMHFGFPYFHAGEIADPRFGEGKKQGDYTAPAQVLGPHVAALGMSFYDGELFPEEYRGDILIPEHGSWNRSAEAGHTGYRITRVRVEDNRAVAYEPFITGWLGEDNEAWGRPNATLVLPDGSLLISDDMNGVIYRVQYRTPSAADASAAH